MAAVAKKPSNGDSTPEGPKILRIGVIQAGKIVEERLIRRRGDVTIGASARNDIVVPASTLPRSFTLFEMHHGQYSMVFTDQMDGRVSAAGKVMSLDQARQSPEAQAKGKHLHKLALSETSRGKVMLGEVTLLFQFVAPPPIQPRPQLPPSVRGSVVGQMDWPLAYSFFGNCAAITAFVAYLMSMDVQLKVAADVIPDDFVRYVPTLEEPTPKLDVEELAKVGEKKVEKVEKKKAGRGKKRKGKGGKKVVKPCDEACQAAKAEARRARLLQQVSRMGALKILGAKGKGTGTTSDLLRSGDPSTAADKAFKGIGGLTTAGRGGGAGLRGRGGGGTGKAVGIGDLGGRVGGPGKVATGGKVEEKVPKAIVKRAGKIERDATLKADSVARTIRRGMRAIQACYQRALKRNPDLSGKIGLRLVINPTGKVTDVEIETDTMGDPMVTSCIKSQARRWRFDPPEGGEVAEVAVPFVFQASK